MKNFSLGMFNNETKTVKKFGQNIVTTIKMRIGDMKRFVLTNEETIVNEGENRNRNVKNFKPFFQNIEKRGKIKQ